VLYCKKDQKYAKISKNGSFSLVQDQLKNGDFCTRSTKKINGELARCATIANSVRGSFERLF